MRWSGAATGGHSPRLGDLSVFMCDPQSMLRTFQACLQQASAPSRRIDRAHFDWR